MTVSEFLSKWKSAINYLGLPSVGIHVNWDQIPADSIVHQYVGKEVWARMYDATVPWFKTPKTFRELITNKDSDYFQIVKEETENGKIEYYRKNGLKEPFFCAFTNGGESFMMLGDGNHRFFDCAYLIDHENYNFESDLEKVELDIIYLENFDQIIEPERIWGQNYNKNETH